MKMPSPTFTKTRTGTLRGTKRMTRGAMSWFGTRP
jgi:hypothetical protein